MLQQAIEYRVHRVDNLVRCLAKASEKKVSFVIDFRYFIINKLLKKNCKVGIFLVPTQSFISYYKKYVQPHPKHIVLTKKKKKSYKVQFCIFYIGYYLYSNVLKK